MHCNRTCQRNTHTCNVQSELQETSVQRLREIVRCDDKAYANTHFLKLQHKTWTDIEDTLTRMVADLVVTFEKRSVDVCLFKPRQLATLAVYHALFVNRSRLQPSRWARWIWNGPEYVPGNLLSLNCKEHLATQCLPQHYDDSGALQLGVLEAPGQAIASAPVVCELCHVGLSDWSALAHHCEQFHFSLAEARKVVFHKASKMGVAPLLPWVKRQRLMGFAFFRRFSVPCSFNDWTHRTLEEYRPRCEKACAVCAIKDWVEHRAKVYLFAESNSKTTLANYFYHGNQETFDSGDHGDNDAEEATERSSIDGQHLDANPYSCTTGISVLVQRTKSTICCMSTGMRNGGL